MTERKEGVEDAKMLLWYQTIPHRRRVYVKRVNL